MPGGCTVVVVYTNGDAFGYDKVKRAHRYMKVIIGGKILGKYTRDDNIHIPTLQEYIEGICITKEGKVTLNKVWHNKMNSNPWELLEPFATK